MKQYHYITIEWKSSPGGNHATHVEVGSAEMATDYMLHILKTGFWEPTRYSLRGAGGTKYKWFIPPHQITRIGTINTPEGFYEDDEYMSLISDILVIPL